MSYNYERLGSNKLGQCFTITASLTLFVWIFCETGVKNIFLTTHVFYMNCLTEKYRWLT